MFLGPLCFVFHSFCLRRLTSWWPITKLTFRPFFSHCTHLLNQIVIDINENCGHSLRAELKKNTNIYTMFTLFWGKYWFFHYYRWNWAWIYGYIRHTCTAYSVLYIEYYWIFVCILVGYSKPHTHIISAFKPIPSLPHWKSHKISTHSTRNRSGAFGTLLNIH